MSAATQRAPDANLALAKAMGAKSYDPMPPAQHEWQRAEGEGMVHRIWSVLCACSLHGRLVKRDGEAETVRTRWATEPDGRTPLTMKRLIAMIGEDDGNVRRGWRRGEEMGVFKRDGRHLGLCGEVTMEKIKEAKEKRSAVCTDLLTPSELLIIKGWPKQRRDEALAAWQALDAFAEDLKAEKIAEARARVHEIESSMRDRFALPKTRTVRRTPRSVDVPQLLLPFVQTGSEQTSPEDPYKREETGQPEQVQTPHIRNQRKPSETGDSVGRLRETPAPNRPTEPLPSFDPKTEHAAIAAVLITEWGEHLHQVPRDTLCEDVHVVLAGAPLPFLRTKLKRQLDEKPQTVKSMGLALSLAKEVGQLWMANEPLRRAQAAKEADHEERGRRAVADTEQWAREVLADPEASATDLGHARAILGSSKKKGATP